MNVLEIDVDILKTQMWTEDVCPLEEKYKEGANTIQQHNNTGFDNPAEAGVGRLLTYY